MTSTRLGDSKAVHRAWRGWGLWAAGALLMVAGCKAQPGDATNTGEEAGCVSDDRFFANEIWGKTLSENCISCHTAQGAAKDSRLLLQSNAVTGYLEANLQNLKDVARYEVDGTSILLLKPAGQIEHGGGQRFTPDGEEYQAFAELLRRFDEPVVCADDGNDDFFAGVELLDPQQALRKVTLNMAGRLPTQAELQQVASGNQADFDAALDAMMTEEGFYARLREIYNDHFLTDRYYGGNRATDLLDGNDYPNRRWWDDMENEGTLAGLSNRAIAREPLELITYVVRRDRPFTEILTADYLMVNAFSARSYGITENAYVDGAPIDNYDASEFFEGRVNGVPHAGVMTSHMFLNRFPTTATNVNRHRARMVYQFFLATDVLKLAERPIDPTQIQDFNPTLYNPACNVCHATIDPVAGAFQNWDERGRYRPPEMGWFENLRPPGFGDDMVDDRLRSVRWLANQIAADERFVTATVQTMYTALTGQAPLSPVGVNDPGTLRAIEVQNQALKEIGQRFAAEGYNLKSVIKGLAWSPWVRAVNATVIPAERASELAAIGNARLLTPEQLHRKIAAVTGHHWMSGDNPNLLDSNRYRIFYGGIDSDTVTVRITDPNGIMSNITMRMANEMACRVIGREFLVEDPAERLLFPEVEMSYQPEDENGFPIPGAQAAIKENIRYLHRRMLGERPSAGDPEVERTYQLFYDTWKEGRDKVRGQMLSVDLNYRCRAREDEREIRRDPNYTARAWMAVLTYLMTDYAFLHE